MAVFHSFLGKQGWEFSALQTGWRRERDSNPRYGFPYSGFQDRPFQPLTHPSGEIGALLAIVIVPVKETAQEIADVSCARRFQVTPRG